VTSPSRAWRSCKFGAVFNTIAPGTHLSGVLRQAEARSKSA
jgi:hypothetical protein